MNNNKNSIINNYFILSIVIFRKFYARLHSILFF